MGAKKSSKGKKKSSKGKKKRSCGKRSSKKSCKGKGRVSACEALGQGGSKKGKLLQGYRAVKGGFVKARSCKKK
jgi:hypothetical protein